MSATAGAAALTRRVGGRRGRGHRRLRRRTRTRPEGEPDHRRRSRPPDRRARRAHGKSDPVDAYAAATAVLSGRAAGVPKTRNGIVEAIRSLRVVRRSAVKSRTQTTNQIHNLIIAAPGDVREQLRGPPRKEMIDRLARSRPTGRVRRSHPRGARRAATARPPPPTPNCGRWSPKRPRNSSHCPGSAPRPPLSGYSGNFGCPGVALLPDGLPQRFRM
ncbi:IS110 family transposase [Embleya hyalina]|uniref:IS110 family transposase n=1 Tax=Embleya hyalina TaxID=516124 RepID=UPI0035309F5E